MAIAFGAIGTKTGGTTTVVLPYPSGVAAGHLAIAGRCAWTAALATLSAESGWTQRGTQEGGTGSSADAHTTEVGIDTLELAGSESGSVTFDTPGAGGSIGFIVRYSKDVSEAWDLAYAAGTDDTHGTNRSVTATTSVSLAPGDVVVAVVATDTDAALTITSPAVTASGITFGTTTRRTPATAGSTNGVDGNIELFEATVSSGTGTAAPALAFTTATSQCGPVAFLRLRVTASGVTGSAASVASVQDSQADGTLTLTGSAATTASVETDAATATLTLTGIASTTTAAHQDAATGTVGSTVTGVAATASSGQQDAATGIVRATGSATTTAAVQQDAAAGVVRLTGAASSAATTQQSGVAGQVRLAGGVSTLSATQQDAAAGAVTSAIVGNVTTAATVQTDTTAGTLTLVGTAATASTAQTSAVAGSVALTGQAVTAAAGQIDTAAGEASGAVTSTSSVAIARIEIPTASATIAPFIARSSLAAETEET